MEEQSGNKFNFITSPRRYSYQVLALIAALLILSGALAGYRYHVYLTARQEGASALTQTAGGREGGAQAGGQIAVHVAGTVANPGLYWFAPEARIYDAVMAAGMVEETDCDALNLAAFLSDGERLDVPAKSQTDGALAAGPEEAEEDAPFSQPAATTSGKININTAGASQLEQLTGIGGVKAAAIIAYRERYGNFTSIEQIMNVSGIGEATFAKIKDDICVK